MADSTNLDDAREALDRSAEAFQVWETEIQLRAAAWVAILQGLLGGLAVCLNVRRLDGLHGLVVAAPVVAGVLVFPWVRSSLIRLLLVLGCPSICVLLGLLLATDSSRTVWNPELGTGTLIACLLYGTMGALLLRRSRIARDALLAMASTWILALLPESIEFLARSSTSTAREFRTHFLISAMLLPGVFVCLTLISRPGRSVFEKAIHRDPLAPLSSVRHARGSARAWASILVIPVTCVGLAVFFEDLGKILRYFL